MLGRLRPPPPRWIIGSIIALFVALAVLGFFFLPQWMVDDDDFTLASARVKAENDIRTIWFQFLGGAVLALGALFAGITLVYIRESQITERFTRAVDQLGHKERDIRVGGIYALERIARDSRRDHGPVMEILTTYVKEHVGWPAHLPIQPPAERPRADIRAALTVLGRRDTGHEPEPFFVELSETDLRRADLSGGSFQGSAFLAAHLEGANMVGADLRSSILVSAHLDEATLVEADLEGAILEDASCRRAEFWRANLRGAFLTNSDLGEATVQDADLTDADLRGASLAGCLYSSRTRWPDDFDPVANGAVLRGDD
jgi:Pentapeptide repeats (8 copies)